MPARVRNNLVSYVVDSRIELPVATAAPRLHHHHLPDRLDLEQGGLDPAVAAALRVLANDPLVTDGAAYYSDFSNTEQKVGFIYKAGVATLQSARVTLTAYDYEFAGRPPLEAHFSVKVNGTTEAVVVIVLHAKAGTGESDYDRRLKASQALKSYLDTAYPTQKVIVIGGFNDDVDQSIVRSGGTSPYANFVNDTADDTFPTKALSDAGISTTVNYPDAVDHHLATNEFMTTYVASSARVLRVDQYIATPAPTRMARSRRGAGSSAMAAPPRRRTRRTRTLPGVRTRFRSR